MLHIFTGDGTSVPVCYDCVHIRVPNRRGKVLHKSSLYHVAMLSQPLLERREDSLEVVVVAHEDIEVIVRPIHLPHRVRKEQNTSKRVQKRGGGEGIVFHSPLRQSIL